MPRDIFHLAYSTRMSADDTDTGEVMLYGEIVQDYGKWYKENYPEDKSASDFDKAIKELKAKGAKKLNLRINSPGGVVYEAVAMRAILTGAGFDSIHIRIEGMCASAATILASIPGAEAEITPGSEYMIHNPWTMAWGNANDMQREVDHLRQLEKTTRGFYSTKSGQTDEQIKEWMDAETWFSAEDAVKYGFCDRMSKEGTGAAPAAACVTSREMAAMQSLYKAVPQAIATKDPTPPKAEEPNNPVSHDAPVAGVPTENKNHEEETQTMDIKDLNMDQLRAENPGLLDSIRQEALTAERQRCEDIDALTDPGCEQLAAEAKQNGMSAEDFHRQIVQMRKQKGANFLASRAKETAPAQKVGGEDPQDRKPEQEIQDVAKDVAAYAREYVGNDTGSMY